MAKYECPRCKQQMFIRIAHSENSVVYSPICSIPMVPIWEYAENR